MTEEIAHARFKARQTFVDSSRAPNNEASNFTKLGQRIDEFKPLLGFSLENRIHSVLQEFACNSKSRYSGRFPRVKKLLDVVAAWAACFDVSAKDTDVRKEVIKHTIEYLVKDGLVTQFASPAVLNTRPNKVDPDSLAVEQNALKSMNVWRFINEKDYWLHQDCATTNAESGMNARVPRCSKENSISDLDVEVGSISIEPSTLYCTCGTTTPCNEKVDSANPSEIKVHTRNFEIIFEPHQDTSDCPQSSPETTNNPDHFSEISNLHNFQILQKNHAGTNCACGKPMESKKSLQTQSSNLNSIQTALNFCKEVPRDFVISNHQLVSQNMQTLNAATMRNINQCTFPRNSRITIHVHKTTSTGCLKVTDPAKVSHLSLPCKSNQLIVRLFEADPTLSDSCLILMKRKFENDIRNACSCINDILKKLEASVIKQLCLNCLIRPGRVDLNLRRKDGGTSNVRRFLARVPTCSNVHKRDSCNGDRESCDKPRGRFEESVCSKELPKDLDPCCCRKTTKHGNEIEERQAAFFSTCSNLSLTNGKETCPRANVIEDNETSEEVTFVWCRTKKDNADFALPTELTMCREKEEESVAPAKIRLDKKFSKLEEETDAVFLNKGSREERREVINKSSEPGEFVNEEEQMYEESDLKTTASCGFTYSCSDSSKKGHYKEKCSTTGWNPERCFCLCTSAAISQEQSCDRLETSNFEGGDETVDCFSGLDEDFADTKESILEMKERISKATGCGSEKNVFGSEVRKNVSIKGDRISESRDKDLLMDRVEQSEADISHKEERNGSVTEVEEKYSIDSICPPNSYFVGSSGDKCSCCGDDLFNSSPNEETNNIAVRNTVECTARKKSLNIEIAESPCLISNENIATPGDARNMSTRPCSKMNFNSKMTDESNVALPANDRSSRTISTRNISTRPCSKMNFNSKMSNESNVQLPVNDRSFRTIDCNRTDYPQKLAENCQKNSIESKGDHEITPINNHSGASKLSTENHPFVPESLFVFCRTTDSKQSSSESCSSIEGETSNTHCSTRNRKVNEKLKSSCERPILKQCGRKSNDFIKSHPSCPTRNLHCTNSTKHKTGRKIEKEDGDCAAPRYKNRLWRGSIVPEGLCSSFPAIDRIKYLIRKKLRKLLLEEQDKGTGTSKTFLRNDRYLVSISSGKLNKGRIIRESCSIRCPFTTRNRYDSGGAPDKTFTEGSFEKKKKEAFGDCIKERCQRIIPGRDVFKRMKIIGGSKSLGQKYSSKSTDTQDLPGEKSEVLVRSKYQVKNKERFSVKSPAVNKKRSSVVTLNTAGMILLEDDEDYWKENLMRQQNYNARRNGKSTKDCYLDSNLSKGCCEKNNCRCSRSENSGRKKSAKRTLQEETTRRDKFQTTEKRLFNIQGDRVEDYNFVNFLSDYEKRINDLDADFRLKLLQYVALCRSVKNSLIKRLQLDDVYEVSSSSV